MMKPLITGLCALALLSLISSPPPVQAQAASAEITHAKPSSDVPKEITLHGTVSSVLPKSSVGMVPGSHLMLSTPSGTVDASLGRFGMVGKGALSVTAGDEVEVTGIMRTFRDTQVFLVRTVRAGGQVYLFRNEQGILISPQARERLSAGQKPAQFGRGL
jgi:hypothetical protein